MEEYFECVFHYGGYFTNKDKMEYVGTKSTWECDPERWSYWEVIGILEEKGVDRADIIDMWYSDPAKELGCGLKELKDDKDTNEICEIAKYHGKIDIYVDNGPGYVLGPGKFAEEVVDNEVIVGNGPVKVAENDVHSEVFGQGNWSENDENGSEDSARHIMFEDSEEVSDEDDGFEVDEANVTAITPLSVALPEFKGNRSTSTVQGKKIKPKASPKAPRKKGRPKKDDAKEPVHENHSADYSLYDGKEIERQVRQIKENRGLSDDGYSTEALVSGGNSSDEEGVMSKAKFPTFQMPKKMVDYKREISTCFVSKQQFKESMVTYAIHSCRNLKFVKNDKTRMGVICLGRDSCNWEAYCGKIPGEDTWQLRKITDDHTCGKIQD